MVYRIYVGGLNASIEKHDLTELFDRYGKPMIWVARSPPGFAFVEIEDKRDAEDAIRDLDGTEFRGIRLKMEFAKETSARKGPVDRTFADNRSRYSDYGDSYHSSHSRYDDRGYGGGYSSSSYGYDDRYGDRDGDRDRDRYSSRYDDRGSDRDRYSSSRYDDRSSSRYDDRRYPSYHDERRGPMIGGEVKCFNCNQIGHYARDCPKEKNQGECYTCGKPGHQSRDCPEKAPYRNSAASSSSSTRRSRSRSPRRDDRDRRSRSPEKRRSSSPRRDTNGTSNGTSVPSDGAPPAQ